MGLDQSAAMSITPVVNIFDTAVVALTDILPVDLDMGVNCTLMIQASFSAIGEFYYKPIQAGSPSNIIMFNDNLSLYANCGYLFDIVVSDITSVNFQYSQNCTCNQLLVMAVYVR